MSDRPAGELAGANGDTAPTAEDPVVEVLSAREAEDDDVDDDDDDDDDGDGQDGDPRAEQVLELAPAVLGQVLRSTGHLAVVLQFIKAHRLYASKYRSMPAYAAEELNLEPHILKVALRAGRVAWDVFPADANAILNGLLESAPLGSIPPLLNQTKLVALGKALRAAPAECRTEIIKETVSGNCSVRDLEAWVKRGRLASTLRDRGGPSGEPSAASADVSRAQVAAPAVHPSLESVLSERAGPPADSPPENEVLPATTPPLGGGIPLLEQEVRARLPLGINIGIGHVVMAISAFEDEDVPDEIRDYAKLLCDRLTAAVARLR